MRASNITIAVLYVIIISLFSYLAVKSVRNAERVKAESAAFYETIRDAEIKFAYAENIGSYDESALPSVSDRVYLFLNMKDFPNVKISGDTLITRGFVPSGFFGQSFVELVIKDRDGKVTGKYSGAELRSIYEKRREMEI